MELDEFNKLASFIARRNINDHTSLVTANYDQIKRSIRVVYYTKREPTDDDWEWCELTCGEIVGSFTDIIHAEVDCIPVDQCIADETHIVFVNS